MKLDKKLIRFLKVLGITSAAVLLVYLAIRLLYPFLIALLLAFCMNPLVNFLEKRVRFSRGFAVLLSMVLVVGSMVGGLFFLSIGLVAGVQYLIEILPSRMDHLSSQLNRFMMEHILPLINQVTNLFNELNGEQQKSILDQIEQAKNDLISGSVVFLKGLMQSLLSFVRGIPQLAISFLFGLLGTFFISKDWYKIKSWFGNRMPNDSKIKGKEIRDKLKIALVGYVKSQVILVSITTVTTIIGFFILRVDQALMMGLLIGVIDFLPYFGTGFVLIPWGIYSLINGDMFLGIGLLILYVVLVVQRNLLEPKVLSSSVGLNTLATIISMYVGLKLFGLLGLIIGPVTLVIITTCIKVGVFRDVWRYIQGN